MSDPLRPLNPGDRLPGIPADGWNAAMDAAQWARDRRNDGGAGLALRPLKQGTQVRVKNVAGGDVPMGGVLGLSDVVFDPADADALPEFLRSVLVEGGVAAADALLVAVAAEPIPGDEVRRAWVSGACPARVRFTSNTHGFAKPDGTNKDYMVSDATAGPARVIAREAGTPPYTGWAYVLLDRGGAGGTVPDCEVTFVTGICRIA